MTGTYAIDAKKKKSQSEDPVEAPRRMSVEQALESLFVKAPRRLALKTGPGAEDAGAFVTRFYTDPELRKTTPTSDEQAALFPVVSFSMDPAAWLSLFAGWRGAKGLAELVLGGGRYGRGGIDHLVVGGTPLKSWDLQRALRFVLALDRSVGPWLQARCKEASLPIVDRIGCALCFDDCTWANALADELMTRPLDRAGSFEACRILGSVDDPERFSRLVAYFGAQMQWLGANAMLGRAVGRLPAEVLERELTLLLEQGLAAKWKSSNVEPYAKTLAHVRSPEVARSLAAWLGEKSVAKVATDYFRAHPDLAAPTLSPIAKGKSKAAPVARAILDSLGRGAAAAEPDAPGEEPIAIAKKTGKTDKTSKPAKTAKAAAAGASVLPAVLLAPPWAAKKQAARPTLALSMIVQDERCPAAQKPWARPPDDDRTPERDVKLLNGRPPASVYEQAIFSLTDEVAFEAIAGRPRAGYWSLDRFLLWFGERAVPHVTRFIAAEIEGSHPMLSRAVSPRLALPCARAAVKRSGGQERAACLAWLRRNPEAAALGLIPAALGEDDADADLAERALRLLRRSGEEDAVKAAAARYGEEAAAALDAVLARSPYERFPHKMPPRAKWAAPERLGALALTTAGALSEEHAATLIQMLQISEIGEPYQGALDTLALLTPASRAAFAKALLDEFLLAGSPPSHEWVIGAITLLAPAESIELLRARMRAWAADGKVALLHRSLEALAALDSDEALSVVYDAGQRSRYDDTRDKVRGILEDVAQARGISYEVLEDLLVPELGLEHGAVTLDLGARTLSVRLGAHLEALLTDAEGTMLSSFPRKAKSDDAKAYEAAKNRYSALVDASEAIGKTQVLRFERALRDQRSWSVGELRAHVLTQPLVHHLASRLVWQVLAPRQLFRVAEDLTLADESDEALPFPPDEARVVLAHPLLAPELSRFGSWLADYRVIQPFAQVGRETYALAAEEQDATSLSRVAGREVSYLSVLALTLGMGWKPVPPGDKGIDAITRELPGGLTARLALSPGLLFGAAKGRPEQTLGALTLTRASGAPARFAELDGLALSELLRDVTRLA